MSLQQKILHQKIAVITGAGRGIGRAIAVHMAQAGAAVVVNYQKNADTAAEVVGKIEAMGGSAFALQGDVGTVEGIGQFFVALDGELKKRHGQAKFDILVNNAGIGRMATLATTTEQIYDELMNVNVKGSFFVAQEAIKRMNDGGRIINLSSALSRRGRPEMIVYSMGKAAINHFANILAADLGKRGITVNSLAPGLTVTEFNAAYRQNEEAVRAVAHHTALGRLGEPDDIASVATFLASDEARWITGQYIEASGGIGLAD
jgi:3-oxoacyl-[acyl-carrier protein] reductase